MSYKDNLEQSKISPRERFQKDQQTCQTHKKKVWLIIPALICLALFGIYAGSFLFGNGPGKPGTVTASTDVVYPVTRFEDGRAQYFEYPADDGTTIRYFILKSADGVIRAAFDACDVCWPANKGYQQENDFMVCRNCGRKFASINVNEVKGGCNPAPLSRQENGEQLVIKTADILQGQRYFDFSNGGRR